jgi:hypothetical protein
MHRIRQKIEDLLAVDGQRHRQIDQHSADPHRFRPLAYLRSKPLSGMRNVGEWAALVVPNVFEA